MSYNIKSVYRFYVAIGCMIFALDSYSMERELIQKNHEQDLTLFVAARTEKWESVISLLNEGAEEGAREAFDSAKSLRRIRVTDLRCRGAVIYTSRTRENVIAEVKTIDTVIKALLSKKLFNVILQDITRAMEEEDENLLRLYYEHYIKIDPSNRVMATVLREYPNLLQSCYI